MKKISKGICFKYVTVFLPLNLLFSNIRTVDLYRFLHAKTVTKLRAFILTSPHGLTSLRSLERELAIRLSGTLINLCNKSQKVTFTSNYL